MLIVSGHLPEMIPLMYLLLEGGGALEVELWTILRSFHNLGTRQSLISDLDHRLLIRPCLVVAHDQC